MIFKYPLTLRHAHWLFCFLFFTTARQNPDTPLTFPLCCCNTAENASTPTLFLFFLLSLFPCSNTTTICPFLPFHVLQQYPHPSHSNSTTPPPRAPCSGFFVFASHHADGPWALHDGSVFPPPPPAVLLFHSKMASALEPLVCSCILRLVVVSVSHGFGTFFSAARHDIPVSSSGSRIRGGREIFFARSAFPSFTRKNQNRTNSGFLGNRER